MADSFTAKASAFIAAPATRVWDALTNPEQIKKYLFGTEVSSDWQEGSPITWRGNWEGKSYEDKGIIKKIVPQKILQSTYWSNLSGTEDKPENYMLVTYELKGANNGTQLAITQDNCKTEKSKIHSEESWKLVLDTMKKMLENKHR